MQFVFGLVTRCAGSLVYCIGLSILFALITTSARAQSPASPSTKKDLIEKAVLPLIKDYAGDIAVACYHFESDTLWSLRGDAVMPTASLIKLPVMIEAYRQADAGRVTLDQRLEMTKDDMVQGSGVLTNHFSAGTSLSLRDAIRLMIVYSDNTATNLVADAIGLPATSASMKALGYPETQLHSKVFRRELSISPERSEKYGLGSTTALDMVNLLVRLQRGELASAQSTTAMLDHLQHCDDKTRFPLLLPGSVKVAHKTGSVTRVRTDAGLLRGNGCTISLCVLTDNNKDVRWSDDNAGNQVCAKIAKSVYEALAPKSTKPAPETASTKTMRRGATGEMVEALQRTLKSKPSLGSLSVDGDFGPATEAAVKSFQKQSNLEVSGVVDEATWQALGPLIEQDKPVPSPQFVNTESLDKQPLDDPFGPPQVTCAAWTIVDSINEKHIGGKKADTPMHIASTTKLMTAYLVFQLAAEQPEVLNEVVTFSKRADDTIGSTAGIRVGESLSVGELMYGLLLPSGNDASVALAEHFGRRFSKSVGTLDDEQSFDCFIAQMNQAAQDLKMMQTKFMNPHGLTHKEHLSTTSDLARLAKAALDLPRFRDYVSCRQRGCVVTGVGGYQRNVKWENTNRLLAIDGYLGLKQEPQTMLEPVWFLVASATDAN